MAYRVVAIFQILNSSRFFQHRVISIFIQYEGHCARLERGRGSEQDEDNVRNEGGLFISSPFVNASANLDWFQRTGSSTNSPETWGSASLSGSRITPRNPHLPILYLTTSSLNQSINPSLNKQISTPKMPIALPTYFLALSAGNIAVLAFGWGKLVGAAPIAIPLRRQRGRIVASMKGMVRWSEGPIPRGGHAE